MLEQFFSSIISESSNGLEIGVYLICTLTSIILGTLIAYFYTFKSTYSKSFVITLAILPSIVQMIIMLVNGNLGTGIAVAGAFSLVRFRSAPGTAKEIVCIFLAMTVGLVTAMGYIGIAVLFVIVTEGFCLILTFSSFGDQPKLARDLNIIIPESLNYTEAFDDLFEKYTVSHELSRVKTSNMGSLYKLTYKMVLKTRNSEKDFIDELRCRNGNLEISCSESGLGKEEIL